MKMSGAVVVAVGLALGLGLGPAAVAQGDGPIGRYRSYVRQFYPAVLGSHGQG